MLKDEDEKVGRGCASKREKKEQEKGWERKEREEAKSRIGKWAEGSFNA